MRMSVAFLLVLNLLGSVSAFGAAPSPGSQPFTESWQEMTRRDQVMNAQIFTLGMPPRVRVHPRPRPSMAQVPGGLPYVQTESGAGTSAAQAIGIGFPTISLQDQFNAFASGSIPPDTMGAVGPNHFLQVINNSVAVYTKTGTRLSHVSLDSFFTVVSGSTTYPQNGTTDPRVLFDRASNRWFASVLEFGNPSGQNNNIILAVCRTSDPLNGTWDKYVIPVAKGKSHGTTYFNDFDTLGVDDNGVYFGMDMFPSSGNDFARIAATPKAPLIAPSPSLGTVYNSGNFDNITDMYASPQPAHNQDAVGPSGRAWFVSSSKNSFSNLQYRTLTWSGGVPTLSNTSTLSTPAFDAPLTAPANGSTTNIDGGDQRILMAVIRDNHLWTTRNVGVNSSGAATSADRTGCEWLELDVSGVSPSLMQNGRVYDPSATNPRFYYYPAIMVNGQGHAVMGFSGSKSSEFAGCYSCGRLATDTPNTMGAVTLVKSGEAAYTRVDNINRNRWGDFSYTSLDPNDDMSMWTIQEYAASGTNIWGTWTARMLSPAPTLTNPNASGCQGQTAYSLALTGTNFYDPGPGYANRLSVALTGGAINGIGNYSIIYSSPTSAMVTFDTAPNATPGPRDIVLTNPDGQSVTVTAGFSVPAPVSITSQPASLVKCTNDSATFCVTATGSAPISYQWLKNNAIIPGATSSCYTIPVVTPLDTASYTVAVTGPCGTVPSNAASLAVGTCVSIAVAKSSPNGTAVILADKVITASFADAFYIEEPNRTMGIRVETTGPIPPAGMLLDVAGTVGTNASGERFIQASLVTVH